MKRIPVMTLAALVFFLNLASAARSQPPEDVLTSHNDIYRSGVYAAEKKLSIVNVNPRGFGKAFARQVLGQIWGQPLYVTGVTVGGKSRNVVYVATSENNVYGFDADDMSTNEQTPPLMRQDLGPPSENPSSVFGTISPSNGISSTPVIDLGKDNDPNNGTLYVVAKVSKEFHIFALDLGMLGVRHNVRVGGSAPGQLGKPAVEFSGDHLNRPALLISNNHLVVAFGSGPYNDQDSAGYHGWVMSYSLPNLVQTGVFVTTPSNWNGMGGIWQSGAGPAADDQDNVYVMSGNGHFQSDPGLLPDLADSFIKLDNSQGKLNLVDWYTPPSRDVMQSCDLDLGASGPAIISKSRKVLGAGKSGILYVLDKDNMGKTDTPFDLTTAGRWTGAPDCTVGQCFRIAENQHHQHMTKQTCDMKGFPFSAPPGFNQSSWNATLNSYPHVHGAPVLWNTAPSNFNLFVWAEEDYLKAFHFDGQKFATTPVGTSAPIDAANMSMPGAVLSFSWDGTSPKTAILWASRPNPERPKIVNGPFVNTYIGHDQQHFAYRDANGVIWDEFFCPGCSDGNGNYKWRLQQINCGQNSDTSCRFKNPDALTDGPAADAGPFVNTYAEHDQQHFAYKSKDGGIWDAFYCPGCSGSTWRLQQINMNGLTGGPPAVGAPIVNVFSGHDQQHFVYRGSNGNISDIYYCPGCSNGAWHEQQINCGKNSDSSCTAKDAAAVTDAPSAEDDPFVDTYTEHDQQHYVYKGKGGEIWDVFYCPRCDGSTWRFQLINTTSGLAGGPATASAPFVTVYSGHDQQHFVYRDAGGNIWDAFYCPGCDNGSWHTQLINCGSQSSCTNKIPGAETNGPPAVDGPFVSNFYGHDQLHYAYMDENGVIQDAFYCPGCSGSTWRLQEISMNGLPGPRAVNAPFIDIFTGHDQQHFAYRDSIGNLWDALFCAAAGCSDSPWRLQQVTPCGTMMMQMSDLTPNDAPCNAINKIVPGYLEAFQAVPDANGQLRELWNSEQNPGDAVRWFAKESPPTIADGKVFMAEFPPKPPNSRWNANTAYGRLIVYSLH